MMKWLRKHTKQIMVVVVLLAMFSFVGAQGLYEWLAPNASDVVLWRAFDKDVTQADMNRAKYDTELLSGMGIRWEMPSMDEDFQLRHWYMLAEEARRNGIVAPDSDVEQVVAQLDSAFAQAGGIDVMRTRYGAGKPQIREAIARNMTVSINATRVTRAGLPSEPQVRHYVRDTQEKIKVKMAVFDATKFVDETAEFSEQDIETQFAKYRNELRDENQDGFGYRFPRRVTIQYVSVSPTALRSQVDVSEEEAIEHWKQNKEKYVEFVSVEVPADPNTTQPAEPKTINEQRPKPFSKARMQVENELRVVKSSRIAKQVMNRLANELAKPWNDVPRDEKTGYKAIPDEARNSDVMRNAMLRVAADFGVTLEYGQLDRITEEDIETNDKIRNAGLPGEDGRPVPISDLAFRIPMFHTPDHPDDLDLRLQLFQAPSSPMVDERQSFRFDPVTRQPVRTSEVSKYVLFRVLEGFEAAPAASVDEVRDLVIKDLREKRGYEKMQDVATEFAAVASRLGTEAALTMFDELRTDRGIRTISAPPAFARMKRRAVTPGDLNDDESILEPALVPEVGQSAEFIESAFAMVSDDWTQPSFIVASDRVEAAMAETAAVPEPKVQLIELPRLRKRVVVELAGHEPVDKNTYATQHRNGGYQVLSGNRVQKLLLEWSSPKNIEARCQYVDVRSGNDPDAEEQSDVATGGSDSDGKA